MSDELPANVPPVDPVSSQGSGPLVAPVLRREALLPNERSRGLGTVAIVCTMAGVASGLALATTLMAMQVADSMSSRPCPYREVRIVPQADLRADHGFLGVNYHPRSGYADVYNVLPGTPAAAAGVHPGDRVLAVNQIALTSPADLTERILELHPGDSPILLIDRHGEQILLRPTLVSWPTITY